MTFVDAAVHILKRSKKPMHYLEITRVAIEEGLITTASAHPQNTLHALIWKEIRRAENLGAPSRFVRAGRGCVGLANRSGVQQERLGPKNIWGPTKQASIKRLSEDFVQDAIVRHLVLEGWSKNLAEKRGHEHGVDIKVRNDQYSRYWLIEVKGDASETAKAPRSRVEVNFKSAIGQIITRMKTDGKSGYKYRYKYGVAYPTSYKSLVERRLPYDVCHKLNLYAFIVSQDGAVDEYDWKRLQRLQKKHS